MKRKMLLVLLAVGLTLSGCGGSKEDSSVSMLPAEEAEEPAVEPEVQKETETEASEEPLEAEPEEEEEAPAQTYVEANGLEFSQDTTFTLQAVRYNQENDMFYEFIEEQLNLESITIEPSETEGYQTVTIQSSASGNIWSNVEEYMDALLLKRFVLCELYTGRIVPGASTQNDMQIDYGMDVEWEGESYHIGYTETTEWEWGDWRDVEPGIGNMTGTIHVICKVTIPEGYDGLALWAAPLREWEGKSDNAGVVDETESYLMEDWKDGDYLLRVSDMYEILNQEPVE